MENNLSSNLILRSLSYHGQQLQKIWEGERGENDLQKFGIQNPDFTEYQARQKHLNFQDRGKRLKLQQFIAKKANALFDASLLQDVQRPSVPPVEEKDLEKIFAVMPPFELFLNLDKTHRLRHFFEIINIGNLIMGTVINKSPSGMMLKVLCTVGPTCRYVADINVKAFCPIANTIPAYDSKKNTTRGYAVNDTVVCEILEVIPDTDKMVVGMKGTAAPQPDLTGLTEPVPNPAIIDEPLGLGLNGGKLKLGLVQPEDFPLIYKGILYKKNPYKNL